MKILSKVDFINHGIKYFLSSIKSLLGKQMAWHFLLTPIVTNRHFSKSCPIRSFIVNLV